jgi:hypothetical protein
VAAEAPVIRWRGDAIVGRTTTPRKLLLHEFVQVQQAWAVRDDGFDKLLDAYKANIRKMKPKPLLKQWKVPPAVLRTWPASDRERMIQMKSMSRRCKVCSLFFACIN